MFGLPSDPPSTPDRRSFRDIPSTTPAGPPPPSSTRALPSFTPKGVPPPSSTFGSSQAGTGRSKGLFANRNGVATTQRGRRLPPSSPPEAFGLDDGINWEDDDIAGPSAVGEDSMMIDDSMAQISPGYGHLRSLNGGSQFSDQPRGNKRSRAGDVLPQQHQGKEIVGIDVRGYAKGLAASIGDVELHDSDDLIVNTERLTEPLVAAIKERASTDEQAELAGELLKVWHEQGALVKEDVDSEDIGPSNPNNGIGKANMLASLVLLLHIPQMEDGQTTSVPKALLEWLDHNHNPCSDVINEVTSQRQGYYGSESFWDVIYVSLNRGHFEAVIHLLRGAKFAQHIGLENLSQQQREGLSFASEQAIDLLEQCPAVKHNNWDVSGSDWTLWRHQVDRAIQSLKEYAETEPGGRGLLASHFGRSEVSQFGRSGTLSASMRGRKVDSVIPFEIYEPLQEMYQQLLGDPADILKSCSDWLEGAIALTVWWDGTDDEIEKGSLAASRISNRHRPHMREIDVARLQAYRKQLASNLVLACEEEDLHETFDVLKDVHLGLASVLLGDLESAIDLMKDWSITLASSLTEIASAGNWIAGGRTRGGLETFDRSDLMVLSYGQADLEQSKRDELLEIYSNLLSQKEIIKSSSDDVEMDGWEMALRLLARIDDTELAQSKVSELLDTIKFRTSEQVDNVLLLCNDLGFEQHAMAIAERFADTLSDSSHRYGDALLYYLRAHKFTKAKKVIDALITSSLIQSTAYPPKDKLDQKMKEFIEKPKETLNSLAAIDFEAAQRLASWLSGYATLRSFYDLRDKNASGSLEARRHAATALLAVISSANDPIRGGLFDPSTEVVVPIDTLVILLGESLPLLRHSPSSFSQTQLFTLLKAVEDLQTIGPRIYAQCESLFQLSLGSVYGSNVPSPRAILRKETSGMTASSQFSLVGSSMLNSQGDAMVLSGEGSEVLVDNGSIKRGWDWRKGLQRTAKGDDVLRVVRLQIAEKVAEVWAE